MKKIIFVLALVLSLTLVICSCDSGVGGNEGNENIDNENNDSENNGDENIIGCTLLEFTSNGDGSCIVSGIGGCTHSHVVVPDLSPDGDIVIDISEAAFSQFTAVTDLTVPDGIVSLDSLRNRTLMHCPNLKNVYVSEDHPSYKSVDGVIFAKETNRLIWYPCGRTEASYTLPEGTYHIGDFAFDRAVYLEEIILPDTCTGFGIGAFRGCEGLKEIVIPEGTKDIFNNTFLSCSSLKSIVLPSSIKSVRNMAFILCSSLTDVYYAGSEDDWSKVDIKSDNTPLINATIHYNYGSES